MKIVQLTPEILEKIESRGRPGSKRPRFDMAPYLSFIADWTDGFKTGVQFEENDNVPQEKRRLQATAKTRGLLLVFKRQLQDGTFPVFVQTYNEDEQREKNAAALARRAERKAQRERDGIPPVQRRARRTRTANPELVAATV